MSALFSELAKEDFMKRLHAGEYLDCPCCGRHGRLQKLRVHSTLAAMLVRLYRKTTMEWGPFNWVHIEKFKPALRTGNDFSIVKHWGLAESKPAGTDEDKNSSGMWRMTDKGITFVLGQISIPRNAFVFADKVVRFSQENSTIKECLSNKFSYQELMAI